ncbi:hypothetical protein GWK36_07265 [Caldichromatium japonicum]|uniref:Uncharacterized protein n=1 Tax=Caldichromatium japonicum TaxID=2699430 RepID=A0A6G7VD54_9GAMM|nr:hypothetical protein [Caldichromatium japonicum]QIK37815.1 hypothetical protein GWK36_07265 [Caldichromatium japonicum]
MPGIKQFEFQNKYFDNQSFAIKRWAFCSVYDKGTGAICAGRAAIMLNARDPRQRPAPPEHPPEHPSQAAPARMLHIEQLWVPR